MSVFSKSAFMMLDSRSCGTSCAAALNHNINTESQNYISVPRVKRTHWQLEQTHLIVVEIFLICDADDAGVDTVLQQITENHAQKTYE
jgi:hypothetical protein